MLREVGQMSAEWRCGSCEVQVRFAPGHDVPPRPNGWSKTDDGWRCLVCSRAAAGEAAVAQGLVDTLPEGIARFELLRSTERSTSEVARVARLPPNRVYRVGRQLADEGLIAWPRSHAKPKPKAEPKPAAPRVKRQAKPPRRSPGRGVAVRKAAAQRFAALYARVDAALTADPQRTNKSIAAEAACSAPSSPSAVATWSRTARSRRPVAAASHPSQGGQREEPGPLAEVRGISPRVAAGRSFHSLQERPACGANRPETFGLRHERSSHAQASPDPRPSPALRGPLHPCDRQAAARVRVDRSR